MENEQINPDKKEITDPKNDDGKGCLGLVIIIIAIFTIIFCALSF